jgi:hypothetical protein
MKMSRRWDSNPRPADYKSAALPAELLRLVILKAVILSGKKSNSLTCFLVYKKQRTTLFWDGKGNGKLYSAKF